MADMTPKEALRLLNDMEFADKYQGEDEYTNMLLVCKNALEKQIPKKVEYEIDRSWGTEKKQPICPVCDYFITQTYFIGEGKKVTYCDSCGQALDWSDING